MTWWEAALWGTAGAAAIEAIELWAAIRRDRKPPWKRQRQRIALLDYLNSIVLRLFASAVVAAAAGGAGQVSNTFTALALGVGAPLLLEKLARAIPVEPGPPPSPEPPKVEDARSPAAEALLDELAKRLAIRDDARQAVSRSERAAEEQRDAR